MELSAAAMSPGEVPAPVSDEVRKRIHRVRGKSVMLDSDLAVFYGVQTFNLNKAVTRNANRFPSDFSFLLTPEEASNLIFQIGISSSQTAANEKLNKFAGRGGRRKPIRVFTEQGVAMLASVLRSPRAVAVSVALVRAFVELRELLGGYRELAGRLAELERHVAGQDGAIREIFEAIRGLLAAPEEPAKEIGFHTGMKQPG